MPGRVRDVISLLLMAVGATCAVVGLTGLALVGHWALAGALAGPYVVAAGIALGYHETHTRRGGRDTPADYETPVPGA